jgi:hypothetical protein
MIARMALPTQQDAAPHAVVIARHPSACERLVRLAREEGCEVDGYLDDVELFGALRAGGVDVVLVGWGVEPAARPEIVAAAAAAAPPVPVVEMLEDDERTRGLLREALGTA